MFPHTYKTSGLKKNKFKFIFQIAEIKKSESKKAESKKADTTGKQSPLATLKEDGRLRTISTSDKGKPSDKIQKHRPVMKSQISQAELTEPLFTYMRGSSGITELIENMGFGTKDPFSKGKIADPVKLHPSIVRLGKGKRLFLIKKMLFLKN